MRATDAFVAAALAASPAAWASPSPPPSDDMSIPHTYIVELEPDADAAAALPLSASDHFSRKRADFGYTARREYNNRDLFYGLSLTVTDGSDASRIERLPGVKRVWQSSYVPRPEPVNPRPPPESGHSPSRIMGGEDGAEKIWSWVALSQTARETACQEGKKKYEHDKAISGQTTRNEWQR